MIKKWNKWEVLLQFTGIVVARAVVGSSSPLAISFFAAMYLKSERKTFTLICVLLGILSALPGLAFIKYFAIMITITFLVNLYLSNYKKISIMYLGALSGLITFLIALANNLIISLLDIAFILALAEGLAVFAFTIILNKGTEVIIADKKGHTYTNEEMVSISIIIATVICGLPKLGGESLILQVFISLFYVLFIAYKYGAGYGAIIGFTCGVASAILTGNFSQIAVFCMLGILAGTFRELGKLTVTIVYFTATIVFLGIIVGMGPQVNLIQESYAAVGNNSPKMVFEASLLQGLIPLVAGSVLFLVLPDSLVYKIYNNDSIIEEEPFLKQNLHLLTRDRLEEFSESFYNLAESFHKNSYKKRNMNDIDKNEVFNELSEELCKGCEKCNVCWERYSKETYHGVNELIDIVELDGTILMEQVPIIFRNRCIKVESFIAEARRIFDLKKLNISCNNKLEEGKDAIKEQFNQVGNILDDFANSIYKITPSTNDDENRIINGLRSRYIYVDDIAIFEKNNKRKKIFLYAHTKGNHCVTTKEASLIIAEVLEKNIIPSEKNKAVISKKSEVYVFEEGANYILLTGLTKMKKDGSLVSGDNYSFIYPDSGTVVMTLSDGMGTGEAAFKESESVINLLEQFIEAGFSKKSAIKLINSVMLIRSEEQIYSTIDMSVINLYTGMCDFIKLGASTTFIKKGEEIEIIQSNDLPIGMINQVDYEERSRSIGDGDFIIMVTDGVIDSIPSDNKEELLSDFISSIKTNNSKEIANAILNFSLESNNWTPKDDMTVLVGGFWERP